MSADENPPVVPPGVQHTPGTEGSVYVSPNTTKGTKKKDTTAVDESVQKDITNPNNLNKEGE
jgi:hypothetical protein